MPDFTPTDYRDAHRMGIALDDTPDLHIAAVDRLYNTLATAYQRLDEECARAHQAERTVRAERDQARAWCKLLVFLLVVLVWVGVWGFAVVGW